MKTNPGKQYYDVIVAGGGAAGMMAALVAAERGKTVLLVERNDELGRKLSITGGGRCNITNAEDDTRELLKHYGKAADFLYSPFSQFGMAETFAFFEERGLPLVTEARKRVFPASHTAADVVRCLLKGLEGASVEVLTGGSVFEVLRKNGLAIGLRTSLGDFRGRSVILASGGMSRPETGSTGDGFDWLQVLGHTVRHPSPGIVPMATKERWSKRLSGKAVEGRITFYLENERQFRTDGRILFTHFGLSGPTILNAASRVGDLLQSGVVTATIDLFPTLDAGACDRALVDLLDANKNKTIKTMLKDWLPAGMAEVPLWLLSGLDPEGRVHSLAKVDRKRLVALAKALPLTITHLLGFDKAVVADGGVTLSEIDMKTMQSKLVANVYIVGDLLDINRPSGGFSLQLCWTTGFVAGKSC